MIKVDHFVKHLTSLHLQEPYCASYNAWQRKFPSKIHAEIEPTEIDTDDPVILSALDIHYQISKIAFHRLTGTSGSRLWTLLRLQPFRIRVLTVSSYAKGHGESRQVRNDLLIHQFSETEFPLRGFSSCWIIDQLAISRKSVI